MRRWNGRGDDAIHDELPAAGAAAIDRVVGPARPHTFETSGLGAAINAAVGLGIHPSFGATVAAMTRLVETRDPHPTAAEPYDALYRRMYERLQPLYEEIREITGYPG